MPSRWSWIVVSLTFSLALAAVAVPPALAEGLSATEQRLVARIDAQR